MNFSQSLQLAQLVEKFGPAPKWTRWRCRTTATQIWVISKNSIVVFNRMHGWKPRHQRNRYISPSDHSRAMARQAVFGKPISHRDHGAPTQSAQRKTDSP